MILVFPLGIVAHRFETRVSATHQTELLESDPVVNGVTNHSDDELGDLFTSFEAKSGRTINPLSQDDLDFWLSDVEKLH